MQSGQVKIYNCGVTVYDRCHFGHARGAINFDVLRNFLQAAGFSVTYVKNYTDIDDKIIVRAREKGIGVQELAKQNIIDHDKDMASLGIRPPDIAPKATEHIQEIIEMVQNLISRGFAYEVNGNVFFIVRKFEEYGKLSGKNIDDLISGSRVEVDTTKKDALDFALWKSSRPDEPFWKSPWGPGRPGWHIECSAMSLKYLGETFDIHAGGSDLIFPHHENEIAQSECCHGKRFVNTWLHNGMLKIEQQKMSKSLGNFATIVDLVQRYHPELIRFFILSSQYRQAIDFSDEAVARSAEGLDRIYGALEKFELKYSVSPLSKVGKKYPKIKSHQQHFMEALADDLNTPQGIGTLFELTRLLNQSLTDQQQALAIYNCLKELGSILGVLQESAMEWFKTPRLLPQKSGLQDDKIEQLITARQIAREQKDWALADRLRDQLKAASVQIEDRDGKTYWKRK